MSHDVAIIAGSRRPGACYKLARWFVSIIIFFSGLIPISLPDALTATNSTVTNTSQVDRLLATSNAVEELKKEIDRVAKSELPQPGPYDAHIARMVSVLLPEIHYSKHPMDDEIAKRALDNYLKIFDPQRLYFLQKDIEKFRVYETTLDELLTEKGSLVPAYQIFACYVTRLVQRAQYVASLLEDPHFDCSKEEWFEVDRRNSPWPRDLEEAKDLWRRFLKYEYLQEKLNGATQNDIVQILARRYRRLLLLIAELDGSDILQYYLTAVTRAFDPHTDYMGKDQLENFAINMKLSLFGIGALLRWEDGYCKIEQLIPGGPAERSGKIKPGDRIIAVQQEGEQPIEVVDMKLQKVVNMIRGPKGTKVTVHILPADANSLSDRKIVTLVRDEIRLTDQRAKAYIIDRVVRPGLTNRIAVIDLPSFYAPVSFNANNVGETSASTSEDVAKLLKRLTKEGVQGLILDLRRNGGGALEEAIRTTGLFIEDGPVVQIRNVHGEVTIESDRDQSILYKGPLIVLVSRFSASASEILAGALQDYRRALIVGDKATFGKGTVQTVLELSRSRRFPNTVEPGALKVTIRKFYRPGGDSTQLRGVVPDIVLPSLNNVLEIGESALDYALPWDKIDRAEFTPTDTVNSVIEELKQRSVARQEQDPYFELVRKDIERYLERRARASILLTEDALLKEKQENEERKKAQIALLEKEQKVAELIYEVTVDNADSSEPLPLKDNSKTSLQATPHETDEEQEETKVDIWLEEAKRILLDWIQLIQKNSPQKEQVVASISDADVDRRAGINGTRTTAVRSKIGAR